MERASHGLIRPCAIHGRLYNSKTHCRPAAHGTVDQCSSARQGGLVHGLLYNSTYYIGVHAWSMYSGLSVLFITATQHHVGQFYCLSTLLPETVNRLLGTSNPQTNGTEQYGDWYTGR